MCSLKLEAQESWHFSSSPSTNKYPQWRSCRFNPWVRKISWRRKWQPTPVDLPGKSHGQRSLVGYSPQGRKESDTTKQLNNNSKILYGWQNGFSRPNRHIIESVWFKHKACEARVYFSFFLLQQTFVTATKKSKCVRNGLYSLSWHI